MKDYFVKFKYIFPVYVLIYLGTVIGLFLLRYLLTIKFQIIDIDANIWELWIPMILPGILLLIFMQPRLKILTFKNNDDKSFFFVFVGWIFIIATTMNSQQYLIDSTGSLVVIDDYQDIKSDTIRYISFQKPFVLDNNQLGFSADLRVSGKHNKEFNYDFFYVMPFVKSNASKDDEDYTVWYCKSFHKQISNRESEDYKREVFDKFYMECVNSLNATNFNSIAYFERLGTSSDYKNGLKAVNSIVPGTINKDKKDLPILLSPVLSKFDERAGNLLPWFFIFIGSGLLVMALLLMWPTYNKKKHDTILKGKRKNNNDLYGFMQILIPKRNHFIVSILLDCMIALYFLQLIQLNSSFMSHSDLLLQWGAVRKDEVFDGAYWRLFTCMFSHGGFVHLLYNGIALVFVGIHLEPLLGRVKFLIYFILSGIAASLASIIWNDNVISVGASGAIFGLFALAIFVDYFKKKSFSSNKYLISLFAIFAGINFIYGLIVPNTDNAGHFGGFLAGVVLAYLNSIIDSEDEFSAKKR